MVLKARDYGFIGLKLKGLIFHENESRRAQGAVNIDGWEEKDCEGKWFGG
jgi:hypothetical protein